MILPGLKPPQSHKLAIYSAQTPEYRATSKPPQSHPKAPKSHHRAITDGVRMSAIATIFGQFQCVEPCHVAFHPYSDRLRLRLEDHRFNLFQANNYASLPLSNVNAMHKCSNAPLGYGLSGAWHKSAILIMGWMGKPGDGPRPTTTSSCEGCRPGALTRRVLADP